MQKIPCVPIFRKKLTILPFLAQICPKRHLGLGIEKTIAEIRISILKIPCVPIFKQNGQLWLYEPKFTQKWILWLEFQKLSLDSESAPSRCEPIFSQNGQLRIFRSKFGEIAQLRAIFLFKYCSECCRELGGSC